MIIFELLFMNNLIIYKFIPKYFYNKQIFKKRILWKKKNEKYCHTFLFNNIFEINDILE